MLLLPFAAKALNALLLGEAEAAHLGFAVERLKIFILLLVGLATGTTVAVAGIIGFIGLVVPHLLRLAVTPDHRWLVPASILAGGGLLLGADLLARTVVSPAELPIGIITALIGAPFFPAGYCGEKKGVGMLIADNLTFQRGRRALLHNVLAHSTARRGGGGVRREWRR